MNIRLNGKHVSVKDGTMLFELRDQTKPFADILIMNGAAITSDIPLKDKDEVSLITRGEIPSAEELEDLLIARHTPGVYEKVRTAVVGIAGLGGLGSSIAVALARVGVGKLVLADFDVVEPSNLNRQQYFTDQIGMSKADAMVSNLRRINPYVDVSAHAVKLIPDNVQIFDGVHVMIEAFDQADQKTMLLQSFTVSYPNTPFIGASGVAGYSSGETIGIKTLGSRVYIVGDLKTGSEPGCGLMAPRVGIAAHMQANLALRLIVDGEVM